MIKKIMIIILAATYMTVSLSVIEMTDKATDATPWNFEIYNKAGDAITVSVSYEGRMGQIFGKPERIKPSGKLRTVLTDMTTPLRVTMTRLRFASQQFWIVPCPQKDECGKTIFLTYDENNILRPQTGPWKGTLGMTESGLSLENNIETEYIFPHLHEFLQFKEKMYPEEYM